MKLGIRLRDVRPIFRGGSRGVLGVRIPPPFFFFGGGGPPNFIKREKNVACVHAKTQHFST